MTWSLRPYTKTPADEQHIAETFRPYLEARDWISINRGEVVTFTAGRRETDTPTD